MFLNTGIFLIQTVFDLYIYVVILRFLLQAVHADYYNQLSQFSIKLTQPIVKPLQKIFPDIKGIDLALVFLLIFLELVKYSLMIAVELRTFPRLPGLILFSASGLLNKFLMFYFYAIVIRIILNLIPSVRYHPAHFALVQLTEPLLRPARHIIPLIAGIDLSPVVVIILLQVLSLLVIDNLLHIATRLLV